ncbi:MAG: type II secretion system protein GspM [Telluria sp.]
MNRWSQLKEQLLVQWNARTEQERRFLSVGGAVVGAALLYALLIAPALEGRAKLRTQIPELRQQAAQVQALAAQAAELARQPVAQVTPMTQESLMGSFGARGVKPESITMTGDFARIQLKGASFAGVVATLDALRREGRVLAQDVNVTAAGGEGIVDGTLTVRQVTSGAAR